MHLPPEQDYIVPKVTEMAFKDSTATFILLAGNETDRNCALWGLHAPEACIISNNAHNVL